MRRIIISVLVVFLVVLPLPAVEKSLNFSASVPEDFGVYIPSNSVRLDRLVFAFDNELHDFDYLVEHSDLYIGDITDYPNGIELAVLYYGNLSYTYDVVISTDTGRGLVSIDGIDKGSFPLYVTISEPSNALNSVEVTKLDENNTHLRIEPSGLVQGEKILDLDIRWDESLIDFPGTYRADLSFELMTI